MARSESMVGGPFRDYAGSHSFFLCTRHKAERAAETMDAILAFHRHAPLARVSEKPIWQKDFFDRQLRTGESYAQKWQYIWQNPIVAKFCSRPEDWPYQGELNVLPWHEPT
jgi:hypothetical protein